MPDAQRPTPAPGTERRKEHVTSTGWRVVGKAVSLVTEAEERASLLPGQNDVALWAARFRVRPRTGTASVVPTILAEVSKAVARDWQDAPPLMPDRTLRRSPGRFQGLIWEPTAGSAGTWRGELLWRHPHPVVAGAPCTTHVVVEEYPGHTTLGIRITSDGGLSAVRGSVGAGQARPTFLADLNRSLRLAFDGGFTEPQSLGHWDIESFVRDVLLADGREHPVAVLAPLEEGGYAVPPTEVAEELIGLAHLYVVDRHQATFVLTDTVGDKRLSCYWGAMRVYMPEFSCADRPEDHPLLVRERLVDPVIRAGLVGTLGMFAGRRHHLPSGVAEQPNVASTSSLEYKQSAQPSASRSGAPTIATAPLTTAPAGSERLETRVTPDASIEALRALAPMPSVLEGLGTQIGALADTIRGLVESNAALRDEIERLRTTTAVRSASTNALERRIGGLEQLLAERLPEAEPVAAQAVVSPSETATAPEAEEESEEEAEKPSLVDVLRQAETAHSDALLMLDPAFESAAESPYEDVDRLSVILDAMAAVARRRQEGALGTSLKDGFRDLGIEYRGGISAATSEKHRRQYMVRASGQVYDCHEHIVLGNSYDPRYCLRVYFTSRAPMEPRFVIGHVGRHFDVKSTS